MILTFLRLVLARFRGRALDLEIGRNRFHLFPDGSVLPVIAGAAPDDPEPDDDPSSGPEPEPEPEPESEDPDPDDPEPAPEPEPEFDADRAMRTIRKQRAEEKRLKAERDAIRAERDALRQEKETEQERTARELEETRAELEIQRNARRATAIDVALRDAAAEEGIPAKKIKRVLRIVDRSDISLNSDEEVEGAQEAIADLLEEFPEFRERVTPAEDNEDDPPPKKTGGNPDRKRSKQTGELTHKQASRLARDDPERFAELLAEGKVGREAMGGKQYDRLKAEGRLDAHSDLVEGVPA